MRLSKVGLFRSSVIVCLVTTSWRWTGVNAFSQASAGPKPPAEVTPKPKPNRPVTVKASVATPFVKSLPGRKKEVQPVQEDGATVPIALDFVPHRRDHFSARYVKQSRQIAETLDIMIQKPVGSLTDRDRRTIDVMMQHLRFHAYERTTRIFEGLLKLLKREYIAGNRKARLTKEVFTNAMLAWCRYGDSPKCEDDVSLQVRSIHNAMINLYNQTHDSLLRPDAMSYGIVLRALKFAKQQKPPEHAREILDEMISWGIDINEGNAIPVVLQQLSLSPTPDRVAKAEELLRHYQSVVGLQQSPYIDERVLHLHAFSGRDGAFEKCLTLLYKLSNSSNYPIEKYQDWTLLSKHVSYVLRGLGMGEVDQVLAEKLPQFLKKISLPLSKGGLGVTPDFSLFFEAIKVVGACHDAESAALLAETILEAWENFMFTEKLFDWMRLKAQTIVEETIRAIARTRNADAIPRMLRILKRMEKNARHGHMWCQPTIEMWNTVLECLIAVDKKKGPEKAEQFLRYLLEQHDKDSSKAKPDIQTFTTVAMGYCNLRAQEAVARANSLINEMEQFHSTGYLKELPSQDLYTALSLSWVGKDAKVPSRRIREDQSLRLSC